MKVVDLYALEFFQEKNLELSQSMIEYPYGLKINPFSHVPTPSLTAAKVLGGRRWKEVKERILICVNELKESILKGQKVFSIMNIVGPLGTGKTHLALHMKTLREGFDCAYIDITRIEPKDLQNIYLTIVRELGEDFFHELRKNIVLDLGERAEKGDKSARKALKISIIDRIFGRRPIRIAKEVIEKRRNIDTYDLKDAFPDMNSGAFKSILNILSGNLNWFLEVKDFSEALGKLKSLAEVLCNLGKVLLIEIDEISANKNLMDGLKAIINEKLPGVILVTILRSEVMEEISNADPSLADRLQKAPFIYFLAQPEDPEEIWDIVKEYLIFHGALIGEEDGESLKSIIKYAFSEFGMNKLRDILALMREVFEIAKGNERIREDHLIEAIIRIRPNAELRDSLMHIPIPDYFRIIKTSTKTYEEIAYNLTRAIRDLGKYLFMRGAIFYAHGASRRIDTPGGSKSFRLADLYLEEKDGRKVVVNVKITEKECLTKQDIEDTLEMVEYGRIDQAIVLTNAAYSKDLEHPKLIFSKIGDKHSIADYIYFSEKFQSRRLNEEDEKNVIRLAKCLGVGYWE
ncbi:MAG: hypothetical protein QXD42_05480 [Nitrososphaerales archaeon]